ncbi:MAG: hypothetical protein ACI358_07895 [Candidatus Limimorpha sp.]
MAESVKIKAETLVSIHYYYIYKKQGDYCSDLSDAEIGEILG